MAVARVDVDTPSLDAADILRRVDDITVGRPPQRPELVAVDQAAEERIRRLGAHGHDRIRADAPDRATQLDVEPVDADRQARDEPRLQDDTDRIGVGHLGREIHVAADQAVILVGRVRLNGLTRGQALGDTSRIRSGDHETRARIGAAVENDPVRREQILHRRRTHRAVIATAERDVADRGQLSLDLVGVGAERAAARILVARIAVATRDRELVDEVVGDDRDTNFAEGFLHVERAADRKRRRALAGEIARLEFQIRGEVERFLPIFGAERDTDALVRPRELDPVIAELAGQAGRRDRLAVHAALEARRLEVGERVGGHPVQREDVVGHAVRIVAAGLRRAADRPIRTADDVEGAGQAGHREVIEIGLGEVRPAILIVDVIGPGRIDLALDADDRAILDVLQIVTATAAFNVAPQDLEEAAIVGRAGHRIREQEGGIAGLADRRAIGRAEEVIRGASDRQLLRGKQRIVAIDAERVAEVARAGDLGDRAVVHEHELEIGTDALGDFIVGEEAGGVTLVRPLIIVQRAEIVRRRAGDERAVVADLIGVGRAREREEGSVRRRRRATAGEQVHAARAGAGIDLSRRARAEVAGAVVAAGLEHRVDLAVARISGDVAAAVREARAEGERRIPGPAVGDVAGRKAEVARAERVRDIRPSAVVVLVEGILRIEAEAFEIRVEDEVDDAGHGIGAIHRRGAAGQHVDAIDERRRDHVDVGGGGGRVTRDETATVDQHEVTLGAEAAKVDRRRAGGAVRHRGALAREDLRQRVDQVLGASRAGQVDVLAVDDRDRAGAIEVRLRNARAGDDDRLTLVGLRAIGGLGRLAVLGESRRADNGGTAKNGRRQQLRQNLRLGHLHPLGTATAAFENTPRVQPGQAAQASPL